MSGQIDIRKCVAALFIGVALVLAVIPICQMVVCHNMTTPMRLSSTLALGASCAAPIAGVLSSSTVQGWQSTSLELIAAFVVLALAAPLRGFRSARSGNRAAPPPPKDPLGVCILI